MLRLISIVFFLFISFKAQGQEKLLLWPEGVVPNQKVSQEKERITETDIVRIENVQNPSIEIYLPSKSIRTGKAVVIFPGGGYRFLAYDWEGTDFAKALNASGIAAFVLKYRLPTSESIIDPKWAPLQDAQRAIRLVRFHAKKWSVDPNKVGIMGFSAGGAVTMEASYKATEKNQPNFIAPIYPWMLIVEDQKVPDNKPPAFISCANNDGLELAPFSVKIYQDWILADAKAELHMYAEGGHGFGMYKQNSPVDNWSNLLVDWILSL